VVQITDPASGATITTDSVLVRGLVDAGGLEVGVTVNGVSAAVQGNTFAALVPVTPETTTLAAIATTAAGATASQSIAITVAPPATPAITLRATPSSGVAPLRVSLSLVGGPAPTAVELDREGDGVIDFAGINLNGQSFTYAQPGLYTPSVSVSDADGNRFTARTVVQVYNRSDLDIVLQGKWTGMRDALRQGRIEGALEFIAQDARENFRADFTALAPLLPTIGQELEDIRFVAIRGDRAQYELLSTENGVTFSYYVEFIRDAGGIWRIAFF
jgi:PKD repeat protein